MSIRLRSRRRLASRGILTALVLLTLAPRARADDDGLAPYRDRFRLGMEKYRAGSLAEAIRVWSGIYEEIGPKRGYRLSFNLARAYDTNGEATRAAERYHSFLDQAEARRNAGEALEPLVEHETGEAEERLAALDKGHGRIQVAPADDATLAQVDDTDPRLGEFTAYVAPGKHVVTFGPGHADADGVEVTVAAGELVVVRPTHALMPRVPVALPTVDPITERVTKHPFSPVVLYAAGVVTAASVIAPVVAYNNAYNIYDTFSGTTVSAAKNSAGLAYPGAKTLAYGLLAVPIGLGAVTGGLVVWYFTGAEKRTVTLSWDGQGASVAGRF